MNRIFSMLLVCLIVLIRIGPLTAETLDAYLKIAGENNPGLKARYYEYLAALEQIPQAASLPDPQLGFSFLLEPMDRFSGKQVGDITFMQMFPWFGSLRAAKDEASWMAKMRFEAFQEAKLGLYDEIRQTWLDLYQIERNLPLFDEDIQILRRLEELALTRFQVGVPGGSGSGADMGGMSNTNPMSRGSISGPAMGGMQGRNQSAVSSNPPAGNNAPRTVNPDTDGAGSMADVLRVQLRIKEIENERQVLAESRKPLIVRFNRLLNRPAESRVVIAGTLRETPLPASLPVIEDAVRLHHPTIKMYEWEARAGESRETMARLMGWPMIGLGLNYSIYRPRDVGPDEMGPMDNGADMIMPMVTLTLPIYRKKNDASLRQAQHQQVESRLKKKAAENDLFTSLESLLWDYESATSRIELYSSQIEITRDLVELLTTTYSVAGSDFEELLRMQQTLLGYERFRIQALTAQRKAVSSINRLMSLDIRLDH